MFTGFFYLLRAHGFRVSLNEWMTLIEGLMLDLQHDSLTGFYELCRAVLVKSEADYDKFDQIFLEYFDGVPYQDELPKELMDWLNDPAAAMEEFRKFLRTQGYEEKSIEEILKMFEERLKEQTEEHNGGSYWIGTNGYSNFGNSGHSPQGIRVGGKSMYRRAFQVAGSAGSATSARTMCSIFVSFRWRSACCASIPSRHRRPKRSSTWMGPCARPATTRERCRSATSVRAKIPSRC